MTINLFDTRTLLEMLNVIFPARTFLLDTFFSKVETSETEHVDIDVIRGKRRLAAFVHQAQQAQTVEKLSFKTQSFKPPYIKQKMPTTAVDILKRQPGQIIYQGSISPQQRATQKITENLATLQEMFIRREEWMASKLLLDGVIPIVGEGFSGQVDFLMPADHKSPNADDTGTDSWNNAASDPLKTLRAKVRLVAKATGLIPDVLILGEDVVDVFLTNEEIRQSLDNRRIELGHIDPRTLPSGASFLGTLKHPALDVFGYDEWYVDPDNPGDPVVPLVGEDRIILGTTRARTARHYGAIQDLQATAAVRWFPKSWEEMDPSVRWIMLQSAVIIAMHQSDAFVSAKVLD